MRFDSEELSELNITDTRNSKKGDEIMFVVFDCPEVVKNVRRRIADVQDDSIKTREYVPPQFFERHNAVSKFAAELRERDRTVKTQIRWGKDDLALYTKTRGTDNPFTPYDMEELGKAIELPRIEYNIKWNRRPDRPAWRQVSPKHGRVVLKSLEGSDLERQRSTDNEPKPKKSKHRLSADSSGSEDRSPTGSPAKGKVSDMEEDY